MKRRRALWVAAGLLGLAAAGLVVVAGGGDGEDTRADLPKLPIGATGGAEAEADEAASSRMAADSVGFAPAGEYVPGAGLPALGGSAPAYELRAEVTEASVRRLADALGVVGEPTDDGAGYWVVDGPELALYVNGPDGSWSVSPKVTEPMDPVEDVPSPTYVPSPELMCPDVALDQGTDDTLPTDRCVAPLPADQPQTSPAPSETPPAPADLPTRDEAMNIALEALAGTGADVDGADVTVDDYTGMEWVVTVEPKVGGLPAPGLAMYVNVGDGGAIHAASGTLALAAELGDYPLLDTRAALVRLNEQRVYLGPAVDLPAPAPADPAAPATVPVEAPPDILVTDAEIVLSAQYSTNLDDPQIYLVPTYRFTADDDSFPEVAAVVDELVERPEPEPAPETTLPQTEPQTEPAARPGGG